MNDRPVMKDLGERGRGSSVERSQVLCCPIRRTIPSVVENNVVTEPGTFLRKGEWANPASSRKVELHRGKTARHDRAIIPREFYRRGAEYTESFKGVIWMIKVCHPFFRGDG
jgi:hypothetical protein